MAMTPFENWFSGDFNRLMREIKTEVGVFSTTLDIAHASWDRKAAYLLWDALGRPNAKWVDDMQHVYRNRHAPAPVDDLADLLGPATKSAAADDLKDLLG